MEQTFQREEIMKWISRLKGPNVAKKYMNPYLAGALLGLVLFVSFFLTGNGLGASGGLNRIVVAIEDVIVPEHINKTPYLMKLAGGDRNALDHWIVFIVGGAIVGGFFSGWFSGRVKVETVRGKGVSVKTRWFMAFAGGALMGYGARFARGCTSGQALSGGSVLSLGSWAFMFAVFAGAYALAWFLRGFWQPGR